MPRGRLTDKQLKYTQLVASGMDEALAIHEAGYTSNARVAKCRLRQNKRVQERIAMLKQEKKASEVANRADREAFWTSMMNDPKNSGNVRLEASKLLGKAQGDFIDRSKVETEIKVKPVVMIPDMSPEMWEQYWEESN